MRKLSEVMSALSKPGSTVLNPKPVSDQVSHLQEQVYVRRAVPLEATSRDGQVVRGVNGGLCSAGDGRLGRDLLLDVGCQLCGRYDGCLTRAAVGDLDPGMGVVRAQGLAVCRFEFEKEIWGQATQHAAGIDRAWDRVGENHLFFDGLYGCGQAGLDLCGPLT